jgi:hypothetical protein
MTSTENYTMTADNIEYLLYGGESPQNRIAFLHYLTEAQRGKSLFQLTAVAKDLIPDIRRCWSPRSFTKIETSQGSFDEVVCNISYHFHKHGQKFGTIKQMTDEALRLFRERRAEARIRETDGLLRFPDGSLFEVDGRIVTFVG